MVSSWPLSITETPLKKNSTHHESFGLSNWSITFPFCQALRFPLLDSLQHHVHSLQDWILGDWGRMGPWNIAPNSTSYDDAATCRWKHDTMTKKLLLTVKKSSRECSTTIVVSFSRHGGWMVSATGWRSAVCIWGCVGVRLSINTRDSIHSENGPHKTPKLKLSLPSSIDTVIGEEGNHYPAKSVLR